MLTGCVITSLVSAYYAVFARLLVAAAGIGALFATRVWRSLLVAAGRGRSPGRPPRPAGWGRNPRGG